MKLKALARPGGFGAWMLAVRPKTLTAGITPVIVGGAYAFAKDLGDWSRLLAALVVGVGIQIGTNLVNDVADHFRGTDTQERLGPPRVTNLGLLTPRAVIAGAVASFTLAAAAGLWLASVSSWSVLIPGALALACGVLYTVGPAPISYVGLSEAFVIGFFGVFATAGTTFVMTERWLSDPMVAGVALGLLAVGILEANNIRDIPTDAPVGKKTLAVRLGDRRARWLYEIAIGGAFVAGFLAGPWPQSLLLLLALPLAGLALGPVLRGAKGRDLIKVLQMNSILELAFGLLLSVAVIWGMPELPMIPTIK